MSEKVSIATLKDGVAIEMFDEALTEAWQSIMDPMRPPNKKREIVMKVSLIPNDSRDEVAVDIHCSTKFPAKKGETTRVSMTFDSDGVATAVEYRSPQLDLEQDYLKPKNGNITVIEGWANDPKEN